MLARFAALASVTALALALIAPAVSAARPIPPEPTGASWSPQQACGAPDTPNAGDHTTAWATATADAGEEWLELRYSKAVKVAQVRIHENNAPGAVSKVVAIIAGEEVVLWQGVAPPVSAPHVFSVEALEAVKADTIRVYLDTRRVAGWNEIDAVELIATDGRGQWAASATASSSYAWATGGGDPLSELVGQAVTITLTSGKVSGRLVSVHSEFLKVEDERRKKTLLVARSAIVLIEK